MFPASALLRAVSRLVPSWRRAEWVAEWQGEIEHAWVEARREGEPEGRVRVRLGLRALGSLADALWLRRRDGGGGWLWSVRDAVRSLRRRPGFALAVIATLALGMGSATAIYTIMDGLMLRPIPFREPEQLVSVQGPRGRPVLDADAVEVWKAQTDVFQAVFAHTGRSFVLTGAGEARSYRAEQVEPGFLEMLGVTPRLGRDFSAEEARPGNDRVVMLSHEVWREAFAGDEGVVGRDVELDGESHTIIGVLPPTLRVAPGGTVQLVLPLSRPLPTGRTYLTGRLHAGLSIEAATARLAAVSEVLARERPREAGWEVGLDPIGRDLDEEVTRGLWTLGAAVLCLLLISCANAAGLLFLRGIARRPELALRVALGSSRATLARHVFAESVLLALAAGVLGTLIAWSGVRLLVALMPSVLIRFSYTTVGIDGRVLAFAFALTLATGLLFGLVPALRTASSTTAAGAGRSSTASRREVQLRGLIQVGQLALAVLLLSGAGLFGRSFLRMLTVPVGYDFDHLVELQLVSLERLSGGPEERVALARTLDERLKALPGVAGVARHRGLGITFDYTLQLEGGIEREPPEELLQFVSVAPEFFPVMGIPIEEGRGFDAMDLEEGSGSVIVDRELAAALWPGQSAVGRSFNFGSGPWRTVVGVTGDVKLGGPLDPYGDVLLFYPAGESELRNGVVMIRSEGDPAALIPAVRALVQEIDPAQPIQTLRTGRQALGESIADPRFLLVLMTLFAAVAVVLAAIGVYGLVSFTVAQRTREIGVRMALGARARRVVAGVFGWGFLMGVIGVALGLGAAALLSRFVSALLFGVSPLDPVAMAAAGLILLMACAAALVLPARRAASVAPVEALRVE